MSIMKRILISKSNNLVRVARTDGQVLFDLEIESTEHDQKVDSICNGEIVSIEPSLEAAFVNFGSKRNGFLPLKEIAAEYYPNGQYDRDMSIKDILFIGQKILVQVTKEERGTKGAALSTFISLAGSYLVLMPNNPKAGGISRRIEGDERDELREVLNGLKLPDTMGVIVRTAGMGRSLEELQWDLDVLLNLWESVSRASKAYGAPFLIHQESDVAIRAIRDHLRQDISEILVDDKELYEKVLAYIERVRPDFKDCVKFYAEVVPLFSRFQLEKQIETAFQRNVRLPSGGAIVIDYTEALITVDVNSAQATKGGYIEETALHTNLEASDEIAKQLRVRDLGGLIVIDFIDMDREENVRQVEERLREALKTDRARVQMSHISRFGLLEMSRQRLRPSINETSLIPCPRCHGQGSIRNIKSLALSIIHLIEEHAVQPNMSQVRVQVPVELATFILNEFRSSINYIEQTHHVSVLIIPNPYIETPKYEIECITGSNRNANETSTQSYDFVKTPSLTYQEPVEAPVIEKMKPIIVEALPEAPAPGGSRKKKASEGWLSRLFKKLFSKKETVEEADARENEQTPYRRSGSFQRNHDRRRAFAQKGQGHRRRGNNSSRRFSKNDQGGKDERNERNDRNDRGERSERPERNERNDRGERSDRNASGDSSSPRRQGRSQQRRPQRPYGGGSRDRSRQQPPATPITPSAAPASVTAPSSAPEPRMVQSAPQPEPRPIETKRPEHATQINTTPRRAPAPDGLVMVETTRQE